MRSLDIRGHIGVRPWSRTKPSPPYKCPQCERAFHCPEGPAVWFTAASWRRLQSAAADATAASKEFSERGSVGRPKQVGQSKHRLQNTLMKRRCASSFNAMTSLSSSKDGGAATGPRDGQRRRWECRVFWLLKQCIRAGRLCFTYTARVSMFELQVLRST